MACDIKNQDKTKLLELMRTQLKRDNPSMSDKDIKNTTNRLYNNMLEKANKPKTELDNLLTHTIYEGQKPPYLIPSNGSYDTLNKYGKFAIYLGIIKPVKAVIGNETVRSVTKSVLGTPEKLFNSDWYQEYHKGKMSAGEGIYYKTVQNLKDRDTPSDFVKRVLVDMKIMKGVDYAQISKYLSVNDNASSKRNDIDTRILTSSLEKFRKTTLNYSKKQLAHVASLFNFSHIHLVNDYLPEITSSTDSLKVVNSKIAEVEGELKGLLGNKALNTYGIGKSAEDLANFYHTRKLGNIVDSGLNERFVYQTFGGKPLEKYMTLVALYQLKLGGKDQLETLKKFKQDSKEDLFNELVLLSRSASTIGTEIDKDLNGKSQFKLDNKTGRRLLFKKNYQFKDIKSKKELAELKSEDKWRELKPYSQGQVGIYVRERADFGTESGIVSNSTIPDDGIHISHDDYLKYKFNLKDNNIEKRMYDKVPRYVLRLTQDMLDQLEVDYETPSAMYRSFAHNIEIMESMSTIKHIINHQTTKAYLPTELDKIESDLTKGIKPMFLNFDFSSVSLVDLKDYPLVKKNYVKTKSEVIEGESARNTSATSVLEFPKYATMVHRDLRDQMLGYSKDPLFKNKNRLAHKLEQVLRDLVTMEAVHWAIVNPIKILMDVTSNASILAIHNVPVRSALRYGKEVGKYHSEFSKLRQKEITLGIHLRGLTEKDKNYKSIKAKYDDTISRIAVHPFKAALDNGFIQSLSTQMLVGDRETTEGLQNRLDTLLAKVDDYPMVANLLDSMANTGSSMVDLLEYAHSKTTEGSTLSSELGRMSKKFRAIKDEKKHTKWVSEIVASPGQSELVRYGGALVTMADLGSKWILYKHTMDELAQTQPNLSLEEREKLAIDVTQNSFIDYRANLPKEINQLKDVGLFMFPHFVMRIQKVIWAMLYQRSANTATSYVAINQLTDVGNSHIINAAIPLRGTAEFDPLNPNIIIPQEFYKLF